MAGFALDAAANKCLPVVLLAVPALYLEHDVVLRRFQSIFLRITPHNQNEVKRYERLIMITSATLYHW